MSKSLLRQEVQRKRGSLSNSEVIEKSASIIKKLLGLNEFKESKIIMSYIDFKNEVMTKDMILGCLSQGKRVVVPVVVNNPEAGRKEIIASEIIDFDNDLAPGTLGILEPKKDKIRRVEPSDIDFVVVPGVAFDIKRNRMGYGAGYYDRFLIHLRPDCPKVGVAFELQVSDKVPVEKHDVPLDMIITEDRII